MSGGGRRDAVLRRVEKRRKDKEVYGERGWVME